jgi:transcriptional regulator with XRE-family HTH domain
MSTQKRDFENIATLVKTYRQPKGISQSQLSRELGYKNGQFISNVERGLCSIPFEKISKLSQVLNVPKVQVKEAILKDYGSNIDKYLEDQMRASSTTQTETPNTSTVNEFDNGNPANN